jgi:hypothetical protein
MQKRIRLSACIVCLLVAFFSIPAAAKNNDSLLMHQLVQRIASQQVTVDGDFPAGMFPSYRRYDKRKDVFKNDDNIFYTGLIVFTLKQLQPYLPAEDQALCEKIYDRAQPVYEKFRNRKGRYTYGFWQKDTPVVFPNAGWLNLMNKSHALPDDMDDTAIILLATDAADSTVKQVHALMQLYRNTYRRKVKNTYRRYKNIPAYSTWFGEKMPVDFDVCVLANVLYLVQRYNLPFTGADSASVELLRQVIVHRQHMQHAAYVSPHYSRPSILLYHLSRLMQLKPLPALDSCREQLIADAREVYRKSDNFMDKIIVSTALLRWGVKPPQEHLEIDTDLQTWIERNDFVFFIANMASMLPNPLKQWLGKAGIGRFFYYCPAYNNTLLLEYLVWMKKNG